MHSPQPRARDRASLTRTLLALSAPTGTGASKERLSARRWVARAGLRDQGLSEEGETVGERLGKSSGWFESKAAEPLPRARPARSRAYRETRPPYRTGPEAARGGPCGAIRLLREPGDFELRVRSVSPVGLGPNEPPLLPGRPNGHRLAGGPADRPADGAVRTAMLASVRVSSALVRPRTPHHVIAPNRTWNPSREVDGKRARRAFRPKREALVESSESPSVT